MFYLYKYSYSLSDLSLFPVTKNMTLLLFVLCKFFQERDLIEGPVPRLDTCLCMLLSITTLAVANIIEEEESILSEEAEWKVKQVIGNRRKGLISSLQQLGDYEGLLTAPQSVSSVANQAAAKAIMYVSGLTAGNGYIESMSMNDMPMNYCKYLSLFLSLFVNDIKSVTSSICIMCIFH